MNTKLVMKIVLVCVLFPVIFLAGLYISAANQVVKSLCTPQIESETKARSRIRSKFNLHLPENATHLYYAGNGFVDADHYAAFSLPSTEECETFIEKELNVKLEDLKEVTELPDDFIKHGPDTWGQEYQDPVWDLLETDKHLLYRNGYYIYAPEKNRFYLHY